MPGSLWRPTISSRGFAANRSWRIARDEDFVTRVNARPDPMKRRAGSARSYVAHGIETIGLAMFRIPMIKVATAGYLVGNSSFFN